MYRAIVNQRMQNERVLTCIVSSLRIVRIASSVQADVIFLDVQPSLGLIFLSSDSSIQQMAGRVEQLQNTFTQSYAILCGQMTPENQDRLQLSIPAGSCRFFSANDDTTAAEIALAYAGKMTETYK